MRIASVVTAAVVLVGCATASKTFGPDGRPSYALNCSGLARSWGDCETKAGELCGPRGYDIVSRNGDTGAVATNSFAGTVITRSLVISCKS
jgi:hypothetical protein